MNRLRHPPIFLSSTRDSLAVLGDRVATLYYSPTVILPSPFQQHNSDSLPAVYQFSLGLSSAREYGIPSAGNGHYKLISAYVFLQFCSSEMFSKFLFVFAISFRTHIYIHIYTYLGDSTTNWNFVQLNVGANWTEKYDFIALFDHPVKSTSFSIARNSKTIDASIFLLR